MASYTNTLTNNPKIYIERNISDNGELMWFSPMNVMGNGRKVPTLLCCTQEREGKRCYSLQAGIAAELETRGYRMVCHDLPCLRLKTAKARREGILALIAADFD